MFFELPPKIDKKVWDYFMSTRYSRAIKLTAIDLYDPDNGVTFISKAFRELPFAKRLAHKNNYTETIAKCHMLNITIFPRE